MWRYNQIPVGRVTRWLRQCGVDRRVPSSSSAGDAPAINWNRLRWDAVARLDPRPSAIRTLPASAWMTDKVGVVKVTWTDSLGNTGTAVGAAAWKIAAVPLRVGTNTITIRAFDAAGNAGKRVVVITRKKK